MTAGFRVAVRLQRMRDVFPDSPIYFLTLNTHERRRVLANRSIHETFLAFCLRAQRHGVFVGRYVLMPDHIHLFATFAPEAICLSLWVKSLKNSMSKRLNETCVDAPHWQKGFFDHVLRSDVSYSQKWEYVRLNPLRAGLVINSDDWEFQGKICDLEI